MMKMFRKSEGFTLVELMVVVLIIGILVAIAIPVFNAARGNAWRRACHANQRTIEGAAMSIQAETGNMPAAGSVSGAPFIPNYIKDVPDCPAVAGVSAYTIDASATVTGCQANPGGAWGAPVAGVTPMHDHF